MRVPVDEFITEFVADVGDVEVARLGPDFGVEDDVQQHVAQLFADVRLVVLDDGICQFVGLLDGVRPQALVRLLAVPRALLPQVVHHIEQPPERFQFFFSCMHVCANLGAKVQIKYECARTKRKKMHLVIINSPQIAQIQLILIQHRKTRKRRIVNWSRVKS